MMNMKKLFLSLVACVCVVALNAQNPYDKYYTDLPCAVEKVQPVVFPDYTVKLTDFGAVGDGVTDCTEAFAQALKHLKKQQTAKQQKSLSPHNFSHLQVLQQA